MASATRSAAASASGPRGGVLLESPLRGGRRSHRVDAYAALVVGRLGRQLEIAAVRVGIAVGQKSRKRIRGKPEPRRLLDRAGLIVILAARLGASRRKRINVRPARLVLVVALEPHSPAPEARRRHMPALGGLRLVGVDEIESEDVVDYVIEGAAAEHTPEIVACDAGAGVLINVCHDFRVLIRHNIAKTNDYQASTGRPFTGS